MNFHYANIHSSCPRCSFSATILGACAMSSNGAAEMHYRTGHLSGILGRSAIALLICAMALVPAGCSDPYRREQTGPSPHPTRGQVLVDGQPASGVNVRFVPVEGVS